MVQIGQEMSNNLIFDRVLDQIKNNKSLKEQGKDIVIPCPFKRFGTEWPGIEQGQYYLVSGNQKSGKTQITDSIFLYNAVEFVKSSKTNIDVKIFDINLEMSKESKIRQAIVHRLYKKHGVTLSTRELKSIFEGSILPDNILRFVEQEREWFEFFESKVEFSDNVRNATGIYKMIRNFFYENGKFIDKHGAEIPIEKILENTEETNKSISHYKANNKDLFVIYIVDNVNLLTPEKKEGKQGTLYDAIGDLSSNYSVRLRNKFGAIPVLIQQQTLGKEGNESIKMERTEPSADSLSDNKGTSKDCNVFMTIYSPFRNRIKRYMDYDITRLKDNFRRLAIEFDREGQACETSLFFNGKINEFAELPTPGNMTETIYKNIEKLRQ